MFKPKEMFATKMRQPYEQKPVMICETLLRDAHQCCWPRMRTQDMLCVASQMDKVGYWSAKSGAARRSIARCAFWAKTLERLRTLRREMPNTRCKCFCAAKRRRLQALSDDMRRAFHRRRQAQRH